MWERRGRTGGCSRQADKGLSGPGRAGGGGWSGTALPGGAGARSAVGHAPRRSAHDALLSLSLWSRAVGDAKKQGEGGKRYSDEQ